MIEFWQIPGKKKMEEKLVTAVKTLYNPEQGNLMKIAADLVLIFRTVNHEICDQEELFRHILSEAGMDPDLAGRGKTSWSVILMKENVDNYHRSDDTPESVLKLVQEDDYHKPETKSDTNSNNKGFFGGARMLRIAICDDDMNMVDRISAIVRHFFESIPDVPCLISRYGNGGQLWYDIDEGLRFDALLLDVEMPDLDGMELASRMRKHLPDAYLIFISSYEKYAPDSFDYRAYRFIPKEELEPRLNRALLSMVREISREKERFIMVQDGRQAVKLALRRIVRVEKDGRYAIIFANQGYREDGSVIYEEIRIRETLKTLMKRLPEQDFIFVNHVLCNLGHIRKVYDDIVEMTDGTTYHIARGKIREIRDCYVNYNLREENRR